MYEEPLALLNFNFEKFYKEAIQLKTWLMEFPDGLQCHFSPALGP